MKIFTDDNGPTEPISNNQGQPHKLSLDAVKPVEKEPSHAELMQAIVRLENKVEAFGKISEIANQILTAVRWLKKAIK